MAVIVGTGAPTREGRGGRAILSLRIAQPPADCSSLVGDEHSPDSKNGLDLQSLSSLERLEANLWASRNEWDIRRRAGGLFGGNKLGRAAAERALRAQLAALEGGDA